MAKPKKQRWPFMEPMLVMLAPELLPTSEEARRFVTSEAWYACSHAISAALDHDLGPYPASIENRLRDAAEILVTDLISLAAHSHRSSSATFIDSGSDRYESDEDRCHDLELLCLNMGKGSDWTLAPVFARLVEKHIKVLQRRQAKQPSAAEARP
jgi:hypothetical protein